MNNKEIIAKRYKLTDKLLEQCLKEFKNNFREIYDELVFAYTLMDKAPKSINNEASEQIKRYAKKKIKEWKDNGTAVGYFKYYLDNFNSYTYANIFELLIYGIYYSQISDINKKSNECFKQVAEDAYEQAKEESVIKFKKYPDLTWRNIRDMLFMAEVNKTFLQYLELLFMQNVQSTYSSLINAKQMNKDINKRELKLLLEKQLKKIVNVNKTEEGVVKHSGLLEQEFCNLVTDAYLFLFKKDKDAKVKFVAQMDKKTTEMCISLDGQEFYVNKENEFHRYSDSAGGIIKVKCKGLVRGLNKPRITDHFHWCRSSLINVK